MNRTKSPISVDAGAAQQLEMLFASGIPVEDHQGKVSQFSNFVPVASPGSTDGFAKNDAQVLSNLIDGWERVPKYCMSHRQQTAMRNSDGYLKSVVREFTLNGKRCQMEMRPARIRDKKTGVEKEFFPTPFDQAVEHILIKMFAEPERGEFVSGSERHAHSADVTTMRAMVRFKVRDIWRYLRASNMERNINQIHHSIQVLAGTRLIISIEGSAPYSDTILGAVVGGPDSEYKVVTFPMIVCGAIWAAKYTQFPFSMYLSMQKPLSRWIFVNMAMQRNLGTDRPFCFTVNEAYESGLVHATRVYDRVRTVESSLNELVNNGALDDSEGKAWFKKPRKTGGTLTDVEYALYPSSMMIKHAKASNFREKSKGLAQQHLSNPVLESLV